VRVLTPVFSPYGAVKAAVNRQRLGADEDGFMFSRTGYRDGDIVYQISVTCENSPHCNSCECDSTHHATLTEEQVVNLRKMLER
jgi:hypothetical protein